jgi:hypothetical protein
MGFPTVTIRARAQANVVTSPYVVFRPRRLVLGDEDTCRRIVIHDFRVGKNSQFCNSSPILGSCFSNVAFPFLLKMDTASIAQYIQLSLENITDEPVTVSAAMFGAIIDEYRR